MFNMASTPDDLPLSLPDPSRESNINSTEERENNKFNKNLISLSWDKKCNNIIENSGESSLCPLIRERQGYVYRRQAFSTHAKKLLGQGRPKHTVKASQTTLNKLASYIAVHSNSYYEFEMHILNSSYDSSGSKRLIRNRVLSDMRVKHFTDGHDSFCWKQCVEWWWFKKHE